jgi:phosphate transport system ATP-binding protein
MSIYENVAYGLRIHSKKNKEELGKAVEHCLKEAGLWEEVKHRLHDPASRLSVGQQQRLCLARAIAVEPEVLLCDEPTSALDPIAAQQIEKLLLKLKENYTVVLVTHTLRQAKRLADYVVFLYVGKVIELGPADEFFNNPKNPETVAYLKGDIS